jgi:hypothetical protein
MPTFHSPRKVVVDEGGGWLGAVAAVVALAVVISSAAALIEDVLTAILITMVALALAGTGVLAITLRRHGVRTAWQLPGQVSRSPVPADPARGNLGHPGGTVALPAAPLAIEAPRAYPTEAQIRSSTSDFAD